VGDLLQDIEALTSSPNPCRLQNAVPILGVVVFLSSGSALFVVLCFIQTRYQRWRHQSRRDQPADIFDTILPRGIINQSHHHMSPSDSHFTKEKEKAKAIYIAEKEIYNPYFKTKIILNSDGFHHLQFSARRERTKREQLYKFSLLPYGLDIIRKSGTIQEYRRLLTPIGKKSERDGAIPMKHVEYWGLVAIVGEKGVKMRTVLRRVGDGNITFWSVMLDAKINNGYQKLFTEGIEDA
jgi:hypothetical protein